MNDFCAVAMDELNQIEGGDAVVDCRPHVGLRVPLPPPPFVSPPAGHPPVGPEPLKF